MQTDRIAVADGVELVADTWAPAATLGTGPAPFVLVHGLSSNARLWDGVAERLVAGGHPVVTVDLRGHGRSSKPDGPYDVPTVADDLAALIGAMRLERPIVAGQSWGGNVALELAARHPGLVRGIVCVDGGWLELAAAFPDWEACRETLAPPRLAGLRRDDVERFIRKSHPDWPESGIGGALAIFDVRPDGTVEPWLTFDRHIVVLRGLWEHHPPQRYASVTAPVLLLPVETAGGPHEERKRAEVDGALAGLLRARVRWFHGDHDIHAQHPAEVADAMLAQIADGFFA